VGRRFITIAGSVVVALAVTAGTSLATALVVTKDQSQTSVTDVDWRGSMTLAQTFTANISGSLAKVSLDLAAATEPSVVMGDAAPAAGPWNGLQVSITATDPTTKLPLDSAIDQQDVIATNGWQDVVFSTPAMVVAGTLYSITINPSNGTSGVDWHGTCNAAKYTRGQALIDNNGWVTVPSWGNDPGTYCYTDFAFETFVASAVPAPTATAADTSPDAGSSLGLGLLAAALAAAAATAVVVKRRQTTAG
jgi:hypothetical protein